MKKKKKIGRPSKGDAARSVQLAIRFSEDELAALREEAAELNLEVATFARQSLLQRCDELKSARAR